MSKAIGLAVLVAFVFALPFVNVCIFRAAEDTIATLDVCSPQAPGATADTTIIAEPAFDPQPEMLIAYLKVENPLIPNPKFFSPIDKPPVS